MAFTGDPRIQGPMRKGVKYRYLILSVIPHGRMVRVSHRIGTLAAETLTGRGPLPSASGEAKRDCCDSRELFSKGGLGTAPGSELR